MSAPFYVKIMDLTFVLNNTNVNYSIKSLMSAM